MAQNFTQQATEAVVAATNAERDQDWPTAIQKFVQACEFLERACKYESNTGMVAMYQERRRQYVERAEALRQHQESQSQPMPASNGATRCDDELRSRIMNSVVTESPNVPWDSVAGLDSVKEALRQAVVYPLEMPDLFEKRFRAWTGILLFGPPGTGKTLLAKAVATECKLEQFMQVSVSDIMGKFVGESERMVAKMFEVARAKRPAVIFLDEVDALCGSREETQHESSLKVKNAFLQEMDGVKSDNNRLLVLAATNLPWNLDDAFMRRFQKHIYIPPPDVDTRARILHVQLKAVPNSLTAQDFADFAQRTDGWSGSDLRTLVDTARNVELCRLSSATHFEPIKGFQPAASSAAIDCNIPLDCWFSPCAPDSAHAIAITISELTRHNLLNRIKPRDVSRADMDEAMNAVRPSFKNKKLDRYTEFANTHASTTLSI